MPSADPEYTRPTPFINYDAPAVSTFATEMANRSTDPVEQAVSLYYAVRDGIRYDPYGIDLSLEGLRASTTLENRRGWCVAKAVLLAACCRAVGIPARLGFADVKNHLTTERLRQQMKTDLFFWHGYTSIYLNDKWVKATPAFNIELCEKFSIKPLEFDGRSDSIYHPFDLKGNRHMEYLHDRGEYADVPMEEIIETFRREYLGDSEPDSPQSAFIEGDFDQDVDRETGRS